MLKNNITNTIWNQEITFEKQNQPSHDDNDETNALGNGQHDLYASRPAYTHCIQVED